MFQDIFHIHTYRCGHASDENDEEYVKSAIELGAKQITFTDHAPFPGDPFGNRMKIAQLPEYVQTLSELKEKYKDWIDVRIGLEIEYLPKFAAYYKQLYESGDFDLLMLGQHFYEVNEEQYSFSLGTDTLIREEAENLCEAMIKGIKTGYFSVVAHPDRMFRKCTSWDAKMQKLSQELLSTAQESNVILEKNLSSMKKKNQYWEGFWKLKNDVIQVVIGSDAHSVDEMKQLYLLEVGKYGK